MEFMEDLENGRIYLDWREGAIEAFEKGVWVGKFG